MSKVYRFISTCLGIILILSGCVNTPKDGTIYLKDAMDLINVLESTHPAFDLGDISEDYELEKQRFINSIDSNTSRDDFIMLVRRYLTVLQDGHTNVRGNADPLFLDLNCRAVGEDLFLTDENGSITGIRVTHIGGVPVSTIFSTVQQYHVAENEAGRDMNNSTWTLNYEILQLAGCDVTQSSAEVTLEEDRKVSAQDVRFVNKDVNSKYHYLHEISSEMIEDIFYIDMNTCDVNDTLEKQIGALKDALVKGTTKVIVDVRDNPGGDSMACTMLLEAMDMKEPDYGVYIRYSKLAHKKYKYLPKSGFIQHDPDRTTARKNENINLVVLTNENTYSSATMLAVFVKDGGLGTVIGTPSSNAPSSYGDILYYTLPKSRIEVSISYKRFLRPDAEADPRIVMPDICAEYGEDILARAVEYLNSR